MAIKELPGVTSGDTIVPSANSSSKFTADPVWFEAGGFNISQNMAIGALIGIVVKSMLSKGD